MIFIGEFKKKINYNLPIGPKILMISIEFILMILWKYIKFLSLSEVRNL